VSIAPAARMVSFDARTRAMSVAALKWRGDGRGQELTVFAIFQLDASSSLAIQEHFDRCRISPYSQIAGNVGEVG
jgi:hypothetical protein